MVVVTAEDTVAEAVLEPRTDASGCLTGAEACEFMGDGSDRLRSFDGAGSAD